MALTETAVMLFTCFEELRRNKVEKVGERWIADWATPIRYLTSDLSGS